MLALMPEEEEGEEAKGLWMLLLPPPLLKEECLETEEELAELADQDGRAAVPF